MQIEKILNGSELTLKPVGRIDAVTALDFEKEFLSSIEGVIDLILDFSELEYISSAGLRILLKMQRKMDSIGSMKICNVGKDVREVIDMTGFSGFLTLEDKKTGFSVNF